ncbi:IclR family transcriptional regulator [Actinobacteria bacterium YIM 96077]|uniref:IclR family transcriptional regulator n=1 Tax=Phytoactinopolyspora halophila TaxID=1981511 RepID=A0A329QZ33_9ACTN|nr:IclR family transcriptional regulator [Phytoactinopolyspora halophila]AYY13230.1 IclR family transcriptional regulator [Actinobacteria bacterium YIM 96077]RAW17531.1 IclR family transcriptional regulator [Phytoactinopolyspora halophila]
MENNDDTYSIRAVHRVCDIFDLIQKRPEGITLGAISELRDFPKSTGYRYLASLEQRRYLTREPGTNVYRMGPAFLPLQTRQMKVLADHLRPHLLRLRDFYNETLNIGALDGTRITYVDILESPSTVRLAARPGDRDYVHATALGKAIAATLPDSRVMEILESDGMPRRTARTITTPGAFFTELEKVRQQGFAIDNGENEEHGCCVAVPLPYVDLPVAVSLAAPSSRVGVDELPGIAHTLRDSMRVAMDGAREGAGVAGDS